MCSTANGFLHSDSSLQIAELPALPANTSISLPSFPNPKPVVTTTPVLVEPVINEVRPAPFDCVHRAPYSLKSALLLAQ